MIQIKKGLLALIVIIALLFGAVSVCFYLGVNPVGLLTSSEGYIKVPQEEYKQYVTLLKTYEKADLLKEYVKNHYYVPVDEKVLTEGMYRGLFDALEDPYSYYLSKEEYESELISVTGDYSGVGITFSYDTENGELIAISIAEDSPAKEAGILAGDRILKVDGVPYDSDTFNEAASAIRGTAGTTVVLTIKRDGVISDYSLVRRRIISKTVSHEMIPDENIGLITISAFENSTANDFKDALLNIESEPGVKGLIIDLRDNGGGLVDAAVEVADCLMGSATIVYAQNQQGDREYYKSKAGRTELPYVILVNEHTASASEILSVGVQANNEGKIVGTKTFGKGIIQSMEELTDGSAVKITMYQYFSANGKAIHKEGVTPDYIVELDESCIDDKTGEITDDRQMKKAIELLR